MTITRDATQDCNAHTNNGTSATANYAVSPPQKKFLVAAALLSTVAANVTIPSGWSTLVSVNLSTVFSVFLCWRVAGVSEPTAVQFSMPGQPNGDVYVVASQYSGLLTASVSDKSASNTSGSQVTTLPTGTTASTAQAEELIITVAGLSGAISSPSWANGTLVHSLNRLFTAQRIVAATGTYADTATWTSSAFPALVIGTFKGAGEVVGGQASETDTANAGPASATTAGAQATETDTANATAPVVLSEWIGGIRGQVLPSITGGQASETDSPVVLRVITGTRASETDTANAGHSTGTITDIGSHFGDYLKLAAGAYIVKNQTLDGANVDLAASLLPLNPAAPYGGWRILIAEVPGVTTINLGDPGPGNAYRGQLSLEYDGVANGYNRLPLRTLLVGFRIINGQIRPEWIDHLRFYRCTLGNEIAQWNAQYVAAYHAYHGVDPVIGSTFDSNIPGWLNRHPSMVGSTFCTDLSFYFCDAVGVGEDCFFTSTDALLLESVRIDNVFHYGINYGSPDFPGRAYIHSDAVQIEGGTNLTVRNSSFGGHLQIETNGSSIVLDFDHWWSYNSDIVGITTDESVGGATINGNMRHGQWFGHGQHPGDYTTHPIYNAEDDVMLYQEDHARGYDGPVGLIWHRDSDDAAISGSTFASLYHLLPSGLTQVGGILSPDSTNYPNAPFPRVPTAFDHATNPAVISRAAAGHGVNDWASYFASTDPSVDPRYRWT